MSAHDPNDNPHPEGTLAAASWELKQSLLDMCDAVVGPFLRWLVARVERRRGSTGREPR